MLPSLQITFSISMYVMCVCLFSALSRRVGALQISTIIIIRQRQETDRQTDRDRETGNRQTETRGLVGGGGVGGGGGGGD